MEERKEEKVECKQGAINHVRIWDMWDVRHQEREKGKKEQEQKRENEERSKQRKVTKHSLLGWWRETELGDGMGEKLRHQREEAESEASNEGRREIR